MARAQRKYSRQNSGAYLILFAVLVVPLLAFYVYLSFRPNLVKELSAIVRQDVESLCGQVVGNAPLHGKAIQQFVYGVNRIQERVAARGGKVVAARLIAPTMEESGAFNLQDGVSVCDDPAGDLTKAKAIVDVENLSSASNFSGSEGPSGYSFEFVGDPCMRRWNTNRPVVPSPDYLGAPRFPQDRMYPLLSAGNTIGCEVAITPKTGIFDYFFKKALSDPSTTGSAIVARAMWWLPIRTFADSEVDPALPNGGLRTGLSLIVSPYGQTSAANSRFYFDYAGEPLVTFNSYRTIELRSGASIPPSTVPGGDIAVRTGVSTALAVPGAAVSRPYYPGLPALTVSPRTTFDATATYSPLLPRKEDFLAMCANPATLVRNSFLRALLELVSRHGQLRTRTEILMAQPQSRSTGFQVSHSSPDPMVNEGQFPPSRVITGGTFDPDNHLLPIWNSLWPAPNPPTLIVKMNQDLRARQYQLPYIFYDGGTAGATSGKEMPALFSKPFGRTGKVRTRFTQPFVGSSGWYVDSSYEALGTAGEDLASYHSLVAGQLRYCFHLYSELAGSGTGLKADFLESKLLTDFSADNFLSVGGGAVSSTLALEPKTFAPRWSAAGEIIAGERPTSGYLRKGSSSSWEQRCTVPSGDGWRNCPGPATTGSPPSNSEGLNAMELVSALGMAQPCPISQKVTDGNFTDAAGVQSNTCWAGVTLSRYDASLGLRGDLDAALRYLNRAVRPGTGASESNVSAATRAPGLFLVDSLYTVTDYYNGKYPIPAAELQTAPANSSSTATPKEPSDTSIVVLYTHQPISWTESRNLERQVKVLNDAGRPVAIIYQPLYGRHAGKVMIERFMFALRLCADHGEDSGGSGSTTNDPDRDDDNTSAPGSGGCSAATAAGLNYFLNLSPTNTALIPTMDNPDSKSYQLKYNPGFTAEKDGDVFRQFWVDLLAPGRMESVTRTAATPPAVGDVESRQPTDISKMAQLFFQNFLVRREARF